MSDEYANNGLKGSLVNTTAADNGNYPPEGDSTSSGGYGSPNVWSDAAQRGRADPEPNQSDATNNANTKRVSGFDADEQDVDDPSGLVQQSLNGGDLRDVMQEMGKDRRGGEKLNPYAGDSFESANDAKEMLAKTSRSPPGK
ncbi:hypothetical protein BDV98DRAFT_608079 [Pterulicium gracile]|uniref:Uncharacterized protein n=1 Tax=Pterulicium gracile TaxID=1884261 RepID=A0A5C3QDW6_9AGAR|nr:hypothetical protein BDV98DRAFT_608079 [Pterula gracilis]